jgi:hypothetical protein
MQNTVKIPILMPYYCSISSNWVIIERKYSSDVDEDLGGLLCCNCLVVVSLSFSLSLSQKKKKNNENVICASTDKHETRRKEPYKSF